MNTKFNVHDVVEDKDGRELVIANIINFDDGTHAYAVRLDNGGRTVRAEHEIVKVIRPYIAPAKSFAQECAEWLERNRS